ncbi:hypothetical protein PV369_40625, partial [Streptomyces scabiei]|uniref:ATP-binding protein n=1 Tax=Streptomyces scabiei TaxID=1930 RepID=UPI0029AFA671|nr:hypothetical protein [Streptomyces scabiei]
DQVSLDIADNGRGFDGDRPLSAMSSETWSSRQVRVSAARVAAAGRERGHGLPAMRVRARQSGGTLTVESTPGEGTVVSAALPRTPVVVGAAGEGVR